jgi:hypothetical protein
MNTISVSDSSSETQSHPSRTEIYNAQAGQEAGTEGTEWETVDRIGNEVTRRGNNTFDSIITPPSNDFF